MPLFSSSRFDHLAIFYSLQIEFPYVCVCADRMERTCYMKRKNYCSRSVNNNNLKNQINISPFWLFYSHSANNSIRVGDDAFALQTRTMDASDHFDALAHHNSSQCQVSGVHVKLCAIFILYFIWCLHWMRCLQFSYCIRSLYGSTRMGGKSGIAWCGWIARAAHFISIHITHMNSLDSSVRDRVFCHIAHTIRFASSRAHHLPSSIACSIRLYSSVVVGPYSSPQFQISESLIH